MMRGDGQESRSVPGIWVIALASNLTSVIDVGAGDAVAGQIQRGARAGQSVEVAHHAIVPEEVSAVPAGIARATDHLSFIVNPTGGTKDISGQRAEIVHMVLFGPEESMGGGLVSQVGKTNDFPPVIDDEWNSAVVASETAQVKRASVLPEQGVSDGLAIRRAISRYTDHLALLIDVEGNSDGVAVKRWKRPDLARLRPPDDCLVIEDLGCDAVWILSAGLGRSNYLASVVEAAGVCVVTAQSGQGGQDAVLPHGPKTSQIGIKSKVAEVFVVRIGVSSLRKDHDPAVVVFLYPIDTAARPA